MPRPDGDMAQNRSGTSKMMKVEKSTENSMTKMKCLIKTVLIVVGAVLVVALGRQRENMAYADETPVVIEDCNEPRELTPSRGAINEQWR